MPTIESKQTGLKQKVSDETFKKMNERKPGLHKVIAPDAATPPEAAEPDAGKKAPVTAAAKNQATVLPAGATPAPEAK